MNPEGAIREKLLGAYRDRPELDRMLDQLREGDVTTVWELGRLARSNRNLLKTVGTISDTVARFQLLSNLGPTPHSSLNSSTTSSGSIPAQAGQTRK